MKSVNPANGELVREYPEMTWPEVDGRAKKAAIAQGAWARRSFSDRGEILLRAAHLLRQRAKDYASLMALEMGKPVKEGVAEVEKCATVCEFYARDAEGFLRDEPVKTEAAASFVSFRPLGVVLAVMPWNFPFWQFFRFAAPALMAGNGALLKHASNVPGCALAVEQVLSDAGLPEGLFSTLLVGNRLVEGVIEHPSVSAVTLTGSTQAGRAVASKAGACLKKTVLELGGSDPYVILADADLDATVETCVKSRLINGGQSCIAAKRFVVVDAIREEFVRRFVARMAKVKMGDPADETSDIGPQARQDLRDTVHEQVLASVGQGAHLLLGGEIPNRKGAWYPPTVLTGVRRGMPAYDNEVFGPVAAVIAARDENEALAIANDSPYGLGAAVFTRDTARGQRVATFELSAGSCFVNAEVRSDPRLPFGGVKDSGYGRELGPFGIREFVNIKTVYVA